MSRTGQRVIEILNEQRERPTEDLGMRLAKGIMDSLQPESKDVSRYYLTTKQLCDGYRVEKYEDHKELSQCRGVNYIYWVTLGEFPLKASKKDIQEVIRGS